MNVRLRWLWAAAIVLLLAGTGLLFTTRRGAWLAVLGLVLAIVAQAWMALAPRGDRSAAPPRDQSEMSS